MTELKTLNDMDLDYRCYKCQGEDVETCKCSIKIADLKQAAIEWVNSAKEHEAKLDFFSYMEKFSASEIITKWIKHFFNITDEDLQ